MQLASAPSASDSNLASLLVGGVLPTPGPLDVGVATPSSPGDAFAQLLDGTAQPEVTSTATVTASPAAPQPAPVWPFVSAPVAIAEPSEDIGIPTQPQAPAANATEIAPTPEEQKATSIVAPPPGRITHPKRLAARGELPKQTRIALPKDTAAPDPLLASVMMAASPLGSQASAEKEPETTFNPDLEDGQGGEEQSTWEDRMGAFTVHSVSGRNQKSDTSSFAGAFDADDTVAETGLAADPQFIADKAAIAASLSQGAFKLPESATFREVAAAPYLRAQTALAPTNPQQAFPTPIDSRAASAAYGIPAMPVPTFTPATPPPAGGPGLELAAAPTPAPVATVDAPVAPTSALSSESAKRGPVLPAPSAADSQSREISAEPKAATVQPQVSSAATDAVAPAVSQSAIAPAQHAVSAISEATQPAEENFAAADVAPRRGIVNGKSRDSKSFLDADYKSVKTELRGLGTTGAETADIMPSSPLHVRAAHNAFEGAVTVTGIQEGAAQGASSASESEVATGAQRAVEAVLKAVEHVQDAERPLVKLQFSVGGADLDVRVEMRADEVHATFRTDSSELRAALAQEWQHSAPSTDRSQKAVTPTFTDNSGFAAFSGDSSSRQRGSRTRPNDEEFSLSAPHGSSPVGSAAATTTAPAPRINQRVTSRHLQTLA